MKRFVALSLLCIHIIASLGVTVRSHYCMGRLVSSSFELQKQSKPCPKCGVTKSRNNCCKDKIQTFKLQNDQRISATTFDFIPSICDIAAKPFFQFTPSFSYSNLSDAGLPPCHAPPNLQKIALYLFNCVLIR